MESSLQEVLKLPEKKKDLIKYPKELMVIFDSIPDVGEGYYEPIKSIIY